MVEPNSDVVIGIDLGTTNSLGAFVFELGPEVFEPTVNNGIIPSIVAKDKDTFLVGLPAVEFAKSNPTQSVYSVKRLMGRGIDGLEDVIPNLSYKVKNAQRKLVKIQLGNQLYTPQEISAKILAEVKAKAERLLGKQVNKAVITVPAYFDDAQRQATKDAGKIAGLKVLRILNEPTAAAIAYGLDEKKQGKVAVYDFGGGTFDISILELKNKIFKVIATHGNSALGGDDINLTLENYLNTLIHDLDNSAISSELKNPLFIHQLKILAETIKIELSNKDEYEFEILSLSGELILKQKIYRTEFEEIIKPLVEKTLASCTKALEMASISVKDIDEVVMVGGSTQIPLVRHSVKDFFTLNPNIAIDPYKVVAIGAAVQAHLLSGGRRDFVLLDVIPLSLGIETLGGTFSKIIMANTTLPTQSAETYTTHVDNQNSIEINIYQGERELVKDCRELSRFKLRGIPLMKAGLPLVEVTFNVDNNGILTVTANEKRSNTAAKIDVIPFHGLTEEEVDKIMESSIENAMDDFNNRQLIEFKNTAIRMFKGIEENSELAKEIFDAVTLTKIDNQIESVKQNFEQQDPQILKASMDELGQLTKSLADAAISKSVFESLKQK